MNIKQIAEQALSISKLAAGREPITTEKLVSLQAISICAVDPVTVSDMNGDPRDTYVMLCVELPNKYFYANTLLTKIFDEVMVIAEGDVSEINKELRNNPLKVKLSSTRTKKGMPITAVELL